jgi:hypothetical protein
MRCESQVEQRRGDGDGDAEPEREGKLRPQEQSPS